MADEVEKVLDDMVDQVLAYKPPGRRKKVRKGKSRNCKTASKTSSETGASRTKK